MLYKYDDAKKVLVQQEFYDYTEFKGKEKDLEDLLANNISDLYVDDGLLMPIFQERQWQEEPDLCALDKDGNLIIFELKRGFVPGDTTIQVMRYAQAYGQKSYAELRQTYSTYKKSDLDLKKDHADAFQLDVPLKDEQFNKHQKLIIVGNSSDDKLINSVEYWKSKGIDIDFLPYRFYKINGEIFFDFFAKPYDYHLNPRDKKGIMFDTNKSFDANAVWDMFNKSKISAYGSAVRYIRSFNKGDYVLYYHVGKGIIGAGIIKGKVQTNNANDEAYCKVDLLTPVICDESQIESLSPSEIISILGKNFYFASTIKSPFLSTTEAEKLIAELKKKYGV